MSGIASNGGREPGGRADKRGRALLDDLAARIEARKERIAAEVTGLIDRFPAPATIKAQMSGDTGPFVGAIAQSLRSPGRRADAALVERWRALGRRGASDDVAISRLIETLEAQAETVIRHVVAEWSTLPPAGRTIEAYLMSSTLALAAQRVAAVAETYLDTSLLRAGTGPRSAAGPDQAGPDQAGPDQAETVSADDHLVPWASGVGLRAAPAYTVVALLLADLDWSLGDESRMRLASQLQSSPRTIATGARWATVGRLGVLVTPVPDERTSVHDAVELVRDQAADHIPDAKVRMAYSGPHPGLAGVQHGFELARRTLGAAEQLGWRGVVRPGDVLLPLLLVSAPDVAAELADLLAPVVCAERSAPELAGTLREYLETGRSVEATARSLRVHPSTVRARLGRVERLLGARVADRTTELELAVLARDLGFTGRSVVATDDTAPDAS